MYHTSVSVRATESCVVLTAVALCQETVSLYTSATAVFFITNTKLSASHYLECPDT